MRSPREAVAPGHGRRWSAGTAAVRCPERAVRVTRPSRMRRILRAVGWPLGPIACANWLIRSSSSSHGTSRSSPSAAGPRAAPRARAGTGVLELVDARASGRGRRPRSWSAAPAARRRRAGSARRRPAGCAPVGGDEAGEDEPAELLRRRRGAPGRTRRRAACRARARTSRAACRIFTTSATIRAVSSRGVAGDEVARTCSNDASSHTGPPARPSARRSRRVAASSSTARGRRVRRLHQHQLRRRCRAWALVLAQRGGDRQRQQPARPGAHVQRLRLRRSPARAGRPSRPRRRATGTRARSGRCRAARRPSGSCRTSSSSGRCARACGWRPRARARSVGRTFSRSASRSCPAAITLPCSSSTLNVIFR